MLNNFGLGICRIFPTNWMPKLRSSAMLAAFKSSFVTVPARSQTPRFERNKARASELSQQSISGKRSLLRSNLETSRIDRNVSNIGRWHLFVLRGSITKAAAVAALVLTYFSLLFILPD